MTKKLTMKENLWLEQKEEAIEDGDKLTSKNRLLARLISSLVDQPSIDFSIKSDAKAL